MTLAELLARITKQEQKIAGLRAEMAAHLAAAEKDGVSDEDKTKALAAFDQAEAGLKAATADLARTTALRDAELAAERRSAHENGAATRPVGAATRVVDPTRPNATVPVTARRYGTLKAFSGPNAERDAYVTGLWVAACFYGHGPSRERLADFGITPQATLSTTDNTRGGYFVPDVMDNSIMRLTEEYGVIRRLASIVPMSSDTWSGPRWTGAMTAYWVGQGQAPTAQSEPTYDRVTLTAKDLATYGKITDQLNEDALIDMGDEWAAAAAIAFAYAEDNAAFNGDGTSTYGGIVGLLTKLRDSANAASVVTASTGHNTLATLTLADYWAVVGKYPSYPGADPRWMCHKEVYSESMGPLQTAAGGVTPADIKDPGTPRFLGYPVEFVNVMPKKASFAASYTGILFGDPKLSTKFGDRRQRSLKVGLVNDDLIKQLQTLFTAERVDIVNHTITDPKSASDAGPMLGLKLAA